MVTSSALSRSDPFGFNSDSNRGQEAALLSPLRLQPGWLRREGDTRELGGFTHVRLPFKLLKIGLVYPTLIPGCDCHCHLARKGP